MPFGLVNIAQTFQRFIDLDLHGLTFSYAHLDGILLASKDADGYLQHLGLVFECLQSHGHYIIPTKCVLGAACLEFLGHLIDKEGIQSLEERVGANPEYPQLSARYPT